MKSKVLSKDRVHRHVYEQVLMALSDIFQSGDRADKVIERTFKGNSKWGSRDRKFFAETVYEMTRWWRTLINEAGINESATLKRDDFEVIWGVYWTGTGNDLPEWFGQDLPYLKDSSAMPRAIRESIPDWMDELGEKELGKRWPAILESLNDKAIAYLRTNTLKTDREKLLVALAKEDIPCEGVKSNPIAIQLHERKNVFVTESFKKGFFEMQDLSSQEIAPFAGVEPGMRVVDACAGAGGKALHLAAMMKNKGKILALDIHDWKLKELKTRAARAGVDIIETRLIDSQKVIKRLAETADRVLLDVPCSGMGVLKRNPDSKWQLSMEEIERLHKLQREILHGYSQMVKPNGKLIYATCSVLPSENEKQIEWFCREHPGWVCEEQLRIDPDQKESDGFFAARLVRAKS
ncbi:MAG: RsmB/NOP family class I SAM-dependent RNA methyltransferase [Pseudobdellovibrionaceae bacterium]